DSYREYVEMAKDIVKTLTGKDFVEDRSSFTYAGDGATSASATGEEWFCPKCGTKNKENFCIKCGTPRPAVFEPFFCSKCGEKIVSAETVFCPKCGNQLR
ncbi:MAG: zinc-ribbon domain-containing protein, partial [Erysipelotrichaceae bacterium]|nr:zinc-ribbon domain-containing protein [Erysipelotrichaceae bacterium]